MGDSLLITTAAAVAVARAIERAGASKKVALLIDDRLDVAFAAREAGVKVDGVHVGQSDVPVEACRKLLGPDAVVGLSARADEMLEYVKTADMSLVDYLGVGPLHETPTKRDCGLAADGTIITKSIDDLRELAVASPVPIVVGGGAARATQRRRRASWCARGGKRRRAESAAKRPQGYNGRSRYTVGF